MKKSAIIAIAALATAACDVDQTEQGALPSVDVDVDAESGALPAYDVDWMDVDVSMAERTITVPKVVVVMEEETVSVPVINVQWPNDMNAVERTLTVSPSVPHAGYDVNIREIYAAGETLHVVATLDETRTDVPMQKVQVSDRVVVNAPDLDVRYHIIGARPEEVDNGQYSFVRSEADLPSDVRNGRLIYDRRS